jgi:hypothetical protein
MLPAGVKFRVLDVHLAVEYLLKTGIFRVTRDMPGTDGAHLVELRPIDGIAPVELKIEQPHESRLANWVVTTGCEMALPCNGFDLLVNVYKTLKDAGVTVTDFFDRPWGGQFWLTDLNDNKFMFFNASEE